MTKVGSDVAAVTAAVAGVLRELRVRHALTRQELSARTHHLVSASSISAYEHGARAIKLAVLAMLCQALGEPVAAVLNEAERRAAAPSRCGCEHTDRQPTSG
ncbi:hypothetical protein DI005_23310 [Prauserella sp. PE36]|uniref:helix-turn-helix domain-containing protein n=1 Tax=Prauserella sp. PE36 TaxID=1504709 RepID=UPI000DE56886|nr:hypothetical protein DI005_23310 [Prauserella sp. PE36]